MLNFIHITGKEILVGGNINIVNRSSLILYKGGFLSRLFIYNISHLYIFSVSFCTALLTATPNTFMVLTVLGKEEIGTQKIKASRNFLLDKS